MEGGGGQDRETSLYQHLQKQMVGRRKVHIMQDWSICKSFQLTAELGQLSAVGCVASRSWPVCTPRRPEPPGRVKYIVFRDVKDMTFSECLQFKKCLLFQNNFFLLSQKILIIKTF